MFTHSFLVVPECPIPIYSPMWQPPYLWVGLLAQDPCNSHVFGGKKTHLSLGRENLRNWLMTPSSGTREYMDKLTGHHHL